MAQREAKIAIVSVQNDEPGTAHETTGGDQNLIICSLLMLLLLNSLIHNHLRLQMLRLRLLLIHLVVPLVLLLMMLRRSRVMNYSLRRSRVRSWLWNRLLLLQRGTSDGRNRRTSSTASTRTHFGHRYEVQEIIEFSRDFRENRYSV